MRQGADVIVADVNAANLARAERLGARVIAPDEILAVRCDILAPCDTFAAHVIGADEGVVQTGSGYTAVLLGGAVTILYIFILNAAFRGAGDAAVALRYCGSPMV